MESIKELDSLPQYEAWIEVVKTYSRCQRLMNQQLAEIGLTLPKHDLLLAVRRMPGASQQVLAKHLLVTKSNVTGLLNRLEADDLIKRVPDPEDARGYCIQLTKPGAKLLDRAIELQADVIKQMGKGLTAADNQHVHRIMRQIGDNLRPGS